MPALSKSQQSLFAIAEHHPEKLHSANRGLLRLSHQQLHDFASTPRKGLPERKSGSGSGGSGKKPKVSSSGHKLFEE